MIYKNILFFLLLTSSVLFAQFENGRNNFGPSVGFSFLGSAIQLGFNHEYGFSLGNNNKSFGVGGIFRYFKYSENFINVSTDYTDILLGIQTNYHFNLSDEKIDPFFGVVLAYDFGFADYKIKTAGYSVNEEKYGGVWIGVHAGLRYWIKENIALSTRIGFGTLSYGALDVGFDYMIN